MQYLKLNVGWFISYIIASNMARDFCGEDTLIGGFMEAGWGRSLQNMCTKYFWLEGGEGGCTLGLSLAETFASFTTPEPLTSTESNE